MINDKEVKATKSPFAMRPNEEKVYDGKNGYSNVNQAVFMVDMGYVNELHFEMLELINNLFIEVNPIPVKTAMNLMGYNAGNLRLPLVEMEDGNLEILKASMKKHNLI